MLDADGNQIYVGDYVKTVNREGMIYVTGFVNHNGTRLWFKRYYGEKGGNHFSWSDDMPLYPNVTHRARQEEFNYIQGILRVAANGNERKRYFRAVNGFIKDAKLQKVDSLYKVIEGIRKGGALVPSYVGTGADHLRDVTSRYFITPLTDLGNLRKLANQYNLGIYFQLEPTATEVYDKLVESQTYHQDQLVGETRDWYINHHTERIEKVSRQIQQHIDYQDFGKFLLFPLWEPVLTPIGDILADINMLLDNNNILGAWNLWVYRPDKEHSDYSILNDVKLGRNWDLDRYKTYDVVDLLSGCDITDEILNAMQYVIRHNIGSFTYDW